MKNYNSNNKLTPQHPGAAMWLGWMHDGSWGVGDVLHACFEYLAAGLDWRSRYDNASPLVDYARRWGVDGVLDPDARLMPHCMAQIDSIAAWLTTTTTDATRAQHICAMVHDDPHNVRYTDVYQVITDNWDDLRQWSVTYRLLGDLVAMQQWWDDADARADLCQIITSVSLSW